MCFAFLCTCHTTLISISQRDRDYFYNVQLLEKISLHAENNFSIVKNGYRKPINEEEIEVPRKVKEWAHHHFVKWNAYTE